MLVVLQLEVFAHAVLYQNVRLMAVMGLVLVRVFVRVPVLLLPQAPRLVLVRTAARGCVNIAASYHVQSLIKGLSRCIAIDQLTVEVSCE